MSTNQLLIAILENTSLRSNGPIFLEDLARYLIANKVTVKITAHWEVKERTHSGIVAQCSHCHYTMEFDKNQIGNYCPYCGAHMNGGKK